MRADEEEEEEEAGACEGGTVGFGRGGTATLAGGWRNDGWLWVSATPRLSSLPLFPLCLSPPLLHSHHVSPLPISLPRCRSIFRRSALFVAYSEELPVFASPYPGF